MGHGFSVSLCEPTISPQPEQPLPYFTRTDDYWPTPAMDASMMTESVPQLCQPCRVQGDVE